MDSPSLLLRIVEELRRAERELQLLAEHLGAGAMPAPKAGTLADREMKERDAVDLACMILAADLFKRLQLGHRDHPLTVIGASVLPLVALRVGDALRFFASQRNSLPRGWPQQPEPLLRALLYEQWHIYAERFWVLRSGRLTAGSKEATPGS